MGGAPQLVSESQVEAMISLLTDDSDAVVDNCRRALLRNARVAEPMLRERMATRDGHTKLFKDVLDDIDRQRTEGEFIRCLAGLPDLQAGSMLLGRLVGAVGATDGVPAALDALADQVGAELARSGDALAAMTAVLVRQAGLRGTEPSLAQPVDALLHGVLVRRRGLPLPLCLVWLLVARRVGIPLFGLNMPGHFLIRLERDAGPQAGSDAQPDSVVIDPFHRGRIISTDRARAYLRRTGFPSSDLAALDASDRDMLLRTLRNLVMAAMRVEDAELQARCERILRAAENRKGA